MSDRRKRGGGRAARQAERSSLVIKGVPYITRKVPFYEVLNEEGLTLIENNAETILQEIGVEFRGDQEALDLWKNAGADIENERVAPFQVFDNLYYVGAKSASAWLLESDQGLILFDSLYGELTNLAIDAIRGLGFDPDDIRYLIVSHAHYDRVGGARKFQDEFGAVVMMTEEDWSITEAPLNDEEYPKPIRHLSASDGSTLNLGRTRLRFFQTPGVTPGVLSTRFTVYDNGYPHDTFLFGGSDSVSYTHLTLPTKA